MKQETQALTKKSVFNRIGQATSLYKLLICMNAQYIQNYYFFKNNFLSLAEVNV
jgi:hypothetical protein